MKTLVLLLVAGLAGCASNAAPITPGLRIKGPDAATLVPPRALSTPLPNEDAKALLKVCRAQYGEETDKLQPLQTFVKRVTAPKR